VLNGYEVHEVYLVKFRKNIQEGQEIIVELMPFKTYSRILVRCKIAQKAEALEKAEELWVREDSGQLQKEPWYIQIIEELDPEEVQFEPETGTALGLY